MPGIGSDHFPMYLELCLNEQEGEKQNGEPEKADKEDKKESKEKVAKAKS